MGYCDGACEYLTSRHSCKKYRKGLTYAKHSNPSFTCSYHERCSECDKDHYIKTIKEKVQNIANYAELSPEEFCQTVDLARKIAQEHEYTNRAEWRAVKEGVIQSWLQSLLAEMW